MPRQTKPTDYEPADLPLGLAPRMLFVTGKGGVGKSTVAAALALAYRDAGVRTLLVDIAGQDPASRTIAPRTRVGYEPVALAPRLHAVCLDSENALREYARLRLRVKVLSDRLVGNPVITQFAEAAPGLNELLILGKLWSLAQEESPRRGPKYEAIIVDAPATGHGAALLGMAGVVARMFPVGPVASEAKRVDDFVRDHERVGVVLVAIPEELPVTETLELHAQLNEQGVDVAATVLNGLVPDRFPIDEMLAIETQLERDDLSVSVRAALQVAHFEHSRARQQREERERLEATSGAVLPLPLLYRDQLTKADVQELATMMDSTRQQELVRTLA